MIELLKMILVLGAGIGIGYLLARTKTFSDYNGMYSHLTCQIVSRMTDAMRSMCVDQDMIDRVIKRMGCKIMPPACPPPPAPTTVLTGERTRKELIALVYGIYKGSITKEAHEERYRYITWLEKYVNWKPSESQMRALRAIINEPNNAGAESCQIAITSLYEDLQKLTEEE